MREVKVKSLKNQRSLGNWQRLPVKTTSSNDLVEMVKPDKKIWSYVPGDSIEIFLSVFAWVIAMILDFLMWSAKQANQRDKMSLLPHSLLPWPIRIWCESNLSPHKSVDNEPHGLLGSFTYVTHLRRIEGGVLWERRPELWGRRSWGLAWRVWRGHSLSHPCTRWHESSHLKLQIRELVTWKKN